MHQNYSYSLSKSNQENSFNNDSVYKISISEYNEMKKRIDEYKSKIESLEEIIKIQDANNNNNNNNEYTLLNKWREKVYQLLIDNKINEKTKNRRIIQLQDENEKTKKEKKEIERSVKKSVDMFYHSFSDIYRQIVCLLFIIFLFFYICI